MTVEEYLLKCAEFKIERGALALEHRFVQDGRYIAGKEPTYLNDESEAKYRPPPNTEDLSHLNPKRSGRTSFEMTKWFQGLTARDRAKKLKQMAAAGKLGGAAKKNKAHGKYR